MPALQDDILEIYNNLVVFSNTTITTKFPLPITVWYEKENRLLVFEQKGKSVRIGLPVYYCLDLEGIVNKTYLLPEDYNYLMSTFQDLINSGVLTRDRTHVSPENYGFDIYAVDLKELYKGPGIVGRIRFISGKSWLFKKIVKHRFKL
jgi:hypothetical protein